MTHSNNNSKIDLTRQLDQRVTPFIQERLARFNEVGDWVGRLMEHIRYALVLVFAFACLLAGVFVSSAAAQAIATGTGAVLAGWAVLQLVRSDDAGFQTVEEQKRFLIAYATCLTGLKAQLEPVADKAIEYSGFRATFGPYLDRLDRFGDGEIAILMALSNYDTPAEASTATTPDTVSDHASVDATNSDSAKLFSDFLNVRVALGALVSGDPEVIDAICTRFRSSVSDDTHVQSATELQGLVLTWVNSTLRTLQGMDTERLRGVYAQMRRTTRFLSLIDADEPPATPASLLTLEQLSATIASLFGPRMPPMIEWYTAQLDGKRHGEREFTHRGSWMDRSHVLWLYQTHTAAMEALKTNNLVESVTSNLKKVVKRDCLRNAGGKESIRLSDDAIESLPAFVLLSVFDADHADAVHLISDRRTTQVLRPATKAPDASLPFCQDPVDSNAFDYRKERVPVETELAHAAEIVREERERLDVAKWDDSEIGKLLKTA